MKVKGAQGWNALSVGRLVMVLYAVGNTVPVVWTASAQSLQNERATVSGFIRDIESGEALAGATVYDPRSGTGAVANNYGFYSLTLAVDSVSLTVRHVSYQPELLRLELLMDIRRDIGLRLRAVDLGEIEVAAPSGTDYVNQTLMSLVKVPIEQIQSLPVLLGETDVFKTLQLIPGVQSGAEATSGIYVRGGGPEQNLVLLDGTPVYNTSHLFGFLSAFNGDAIKDVTLIKGGFPARYGGRLSSVVEMTMKEGNLKRFAGKGAVGIVSSRFTLEGPIKKDRASFLVSGRRTIYDLLIYPFLPSDSKSLAYFFDLNAKANYILSSNDRIYLSIYSGGTRFSSRQKSTSEEVRRGDKYSLGWGNVTGTLRWNHIFGPKLFANLTLGNSQYGLEVFQEKYYRHNLEITAINSLHRLHYTTDVKDLAARTDFEYAPNALHYVRFGVGATRQSFHPGVLLERLETINSESVEEDSSDMEGPTRSTTLSVYLEDDLALLGPLRANLGVRVETFGVRGAQYTSVQPRLSLHYQLAGNTAVKASYARMQQKVHLLSSSNALSLPTDLWVSATERTPPQKAWQAAAGVAYQFGQRRYQVTLEGYYKEMHNVIDYRDGDHFFNITGGGWEDKIEHGQGTSYGMELFVQRTVGRATGWVGYTLSRTDRNFAGLNDGKPFPFTHDRRHDASVAITYRLREHMEVSVAWVYGSGRAVWLPAGFLPVEAHAPAPLGTVDLGYTSGTPARNAFIYGARNHSRMPSAHRLDLAMHLHKEKRRTRRTLSLGVYNAYNRRNPFILRLEEQGDGSLVFKKISIFHVIPSIVYELEF